MKDNLSLIYRGQMPNLLCCDTILRKMQNGEWVMIMLSGGYMEPLPENSVFICRSKDKGATWSNPARVFKSTNKTLVPTELIIFKDKCVMFVISHDGKFHDWENYYAESTDNGYTWSELMPFTASFNNTAIRTLYIMRNGEMILPYQRYEIDIDEYNKVKDKDKYFFENRISIKPINGVLTSNDEGKTWIRQNGISVDVNHWIWAENNVVELSNGLLAMLTRVDGSGVLYRADSSDGGKSWNSEYAYATDIPNAGAKFRLFSLKDGRIALIHNPAPAKDNCMNGRNPLSLWISDDDMKTWSVKRDLVTFPGWLSYPDGFVDEDDGYIHFAFDYNRHDAIYVGAALK